MGFVSTTKQSFLNLTMNMNKWYYCNHNFTFLTNGFCLVVVTVIKSNLEEGPIEIPFHASFYSNNQGWTMDKYSSITCP